MNLLFTEWIAIIQIADTQLSPKLLLFFEETIQKCMDIHCWILNLCVNQLSNLHLSSSCMWLLCSRFSWSRYESTFSSTIICPAFAEREGYSGINQNPLRRMFTLQLGSGNTEELETLTCYAMKELNDVKETRWLLLYLLIFAATPIFTMMGRYVPASMDR